MHDQEIVVSLRGGSWNGVADGYTRITSAVLLKIQLQLDFKVIVPKKSRSNMNRTVFPVGILFLAATPLGKVMVMLEDSGLGNKNDYSVDDDDGQLTFIECSLCIRDWS